jgi:hypothetical protein
MNLNLLPLNLISCIIIENLTLFQVSVAFDTFTLQVIGLDWGKGSCWLMDWRLGCGRIFLIVSNLSFSSMIFQNYYLRLL